jgi:hypothetical protein
MALAPLRNAYTFLDNAPTAMNLRENVSTNSPVWSATQQYFKNDCVVSPTTGGMFIFAGQDPAASTTIRGGLDPWDDSFSAVPNWVSLAPAGLNDVTSTPVTATIAQTASAAAVVSAGSFGLDATLATPGATYMVNWQGIWNNGGVAFTATDQLIWSFAPNGTGAATVSASENPGVTVAPFRMSGSVVVTIPVDGTQIVGNLSVGLSALGAAATLSGLRVTYSRIQ